MERQRSQEPGAVQSDPARVEWPQVPKNELQSSNGGHGDITLPDLKTVLSPQFQHLAPSTSVPNALPYGSPVSTGSLPHINPGRAGEYLDGARRSVDMGLASPTEAGSVRSDDDRGRARSAVPTDDDVRIAAEALSGLSGPGFARSPINAPSQTMSPHEKVLATRAQQHGDIASEPLLKLFASKHPWVGGTVNGSINGSMYVYNTTKHYSPRFVQYGARLVEQNVAAPMINTVGSVGRITGVENGLRRYFDGRTQGDVERDGGKQVDHSDAMDVDAEEVSEGLPAYRASKPPSYREEYSPVTTERSRESRQRPGHDRSWSSQVLVLTSGLGVALSATSRQSLQYCLGALGEGSSRVETCMKALKLVLEQYDQARDSWHQQNDDAVEKGERPQTPDHDDAARRLADIIKYHSDEIWNTLKTVTNYISNSAGAALPENARHFVRSQVMSLPQRWQLVSQNQTGESETSRSAQRMIAFATEGLDMMSQISHVVTATLESAERWLQRAGRGGVNTQQQQYGYIDDKRHHSNGAEGRHESYT